MKSSAIKKLLSVYLHPGARLPAAFEKRLLIKMPKLIGECLFKPKTFGDFLHGRSAFLRHVLRHLPELVGRLALYHL
nr:MAG TPA: hypothetical protein [Caudoviricetes sp.]